jgi:hypothetical protein
MHVMQANGKSDTLNCGDLPRRYLNHQLYTESSANAVLFGFNTNFAGHNID